MSTTCDICQGFIEDCIQLPLAECEADKAFIKPKSLHAHAGEIARQLFAIYARIPHTYRSYNCESVFAQMIEEGADGECLLQALEARKK